MASYKRSYRKNTNSIQQSSEASNHEEIHNKKLIAENFNGFFCNRWTKTSRIDT